ncbi:MAG: tetratricopeptide repeat protein [Caulobacteraceae bacterium]
MTGARELFQTAAQAHQAGRMDEARAGYEAILAIDPRDPNALTNLGALFAQQGRLEEGLALIERSLAERPGQAGAMVNKAHVLSGTGRLDDAFAVLKALPCLDSAGMGVCVELAERLQTAGDGHKALDALDLALRDYPHDAEIQNRRAIVLVGLRRYDEARQAFETLLESAPGYAFARLNLGIVLQHLNRSRTRSRRSSERAATARATLGSTRPSARACASSGVSTKPWPPTTGRRRAGPTCSPRSSAA